MYFTKKLQLLGLFIPQTPYLGSAPGPRWVTSVSQTPCLLLCPPHNNPEIEAFAQRRKYGYRR